MEDGKLPKDSIEDTWRSHRISEAKRIRRVFRWWQYWYNIGYRKRMFRELDSQIFISNSQKKLIARHQDLAGLKTAVVYNPVNDADIAEHAKVGQGGAVVYIGTTENYKGVDLLIEAWSDVVKSKGSAYLRIVGDGADRQNYEKKAANKGLQYKVKFEGRVKWNRLQSIYDQTEIVVAPHRWIEPFGRTVAEAMSRGKIVVAANDGGPSEMVIDGKNGLLFARNDAKDLSAKIRTGLEMSKGERAALGKNAINWVRENLSSKKIARQYEEHFREVLGSLR